MSLTIRELVDESFATANAHGWWPTGDTPNIPEKIALMHSELSEALEEVRSGRDPAVMYAEPDYGASSYKESLARSQREPAHGLPKPEGFPSELADVVIRIADLCGYYGIDLEAALAAKMAYNKTRPFRHGGKTC